MSRLIALVVAIALFQAPVFSQKKDTYKVRTVVIDPGHGGAKPGAKGARTYEKNITLDIAKKFGKLIEDNYPDVKVIYTRTTDVDISLAERAHIANRNKADLFISIHANSHPTSSPTGVETFVMGLSESRANLEVARTENADILLETDYQKNDAYKGFDPNAPESYVMLAMFQNSFIDKSLNLAQAIQTQYKQHLKTINRGVKQAELFVLYKTTCPSVLTEVGFISNPGEEAFMVSDEGQATIAVCLFNAFMNYKASEEGSKRIANPVINIKGYKAPKEESKAAPAEVAVTVAEAPKAEPVPEPRSEPVPAPQPRSEAVPALQPEVAEVTPEAPAVEPVPEPLPIVVTTPTARPVPTAELAPQPAQPVVKEESQPQPAATPVETPTPQPEPQPQPKAEQPLPAEGPQPLAAPVNTAAEDAATYYTVQFLTSGSELSTSGLLEGIDDIEVGRAGKLYTYSVGRFATYKEAVAYKHEVHRATRYKDAWATQRKASNPKAEAPAAAEHAEAKPHTEKPHTEHKHAEPAHDGTVYRIQFCTAQREMKAGDPDLCGIKDFRCAKTNNGYLYTTGDFKTRAEANKRLAEIKHKTRFKDAFVIAIRNGERIHQYMHHK